MHFHNSKTFPKLLIGGLAILCGVFVAISPIGSALDNVGYDLNFLLRGPQSEAQDVVVVAIDEASFQEIGQTWPWQRSIHAQLIESLFKQGAKTVVLDLILADPSSEDEDQALENSLNKHGPIILATDVAITRSHAFERVISVQPLARFLTDKVIKGYAGLPVDNDGFVRYFGHKSTTGEDSLALAAVSAFRPASTPINNVLNYAGINFVGPAGFINQVSYYQVLLGEQYLNPNRLKDKLVFVGLVTHSQVMDQSAARDSYPTPYMRWGSSYMNGVEIHANAAQSLLRKNQIVIIDLYLLLFMAMLLASSSWWFMNRYPPNVTLIPLAIVFISIAGVSYWLYASHHYYTSWPLILLPSLFVYISSPVVHFINTRRERNFIHKAFASYISKDVVNQLMDDPRLLKLGGTIKTGTVLFLDLEGFTSLSERLTPPALLELLNQYLGELSDIAIAEGGMVDKFIGDCIMVVWGAPLSDEQHAKRACYAAIKMQERIKQIGIERNESSELSIRARIGINSGEFVAGNIGGSQKFDYTVLGDSVNLASRLEGINKIYATSIILSEATVNQLGSDFDFRQIDTIRVKGKSIAVNAYELIGLCGVRTEQQKQNEVDFQIARTLYANGEFKQAGEVFDRIAAQKPIDLVSKVLAMRCHAFVKAPPKSWHGVYEV